MTYSDTSPQQTPPRKRAVWFAIPASIIAYLGTYMLLTYSMVILTYTWADFTDGTYPRSFRPGDAGSRWWFVLLAINFLPTVVTGLVAAWQSPPFSKTPLAILLVFALLYVFFTQLPSYSFWLSILWILTYPLGICIGFMLYWKYEKAKLFNQV